MASGLPQRSHSVNLIARWMVGVMWNLTNMLSGWTRRPTQSLMHQILWKRTIETLEKNRNSTPVEPLRSVEGEVRGRWLRRDRLAQLVAHDGWVQKRIHFFEGWGSDAHMITGTVPDRTLSGVCSTHLPSVCEKERTKNFYRLKAGGYCILPRVKYPPAFSLWKREN